MKLNFIIIVILITLLSKNSGAQTVLKKVKPSDTNSNITLAITDSNYVYYNPSIISKNMLLIFIPGRQGKCGDYQKFCTLASDLGYHVITISYPNTYNIIGSCSTNSDEKAFEKIRTEVLYGFDSSTIVNVNTNNCIETRMLSLLEYLNINFPTENWAQYITTGQLQSNKCVIAGFSLGAEYGVLFSKTHLVKRVISFSARNDFNYIYGSSSWHDTSSFVTKNNNYYNFYHVNDFYIPEDSMVLYNRGIYDFGSFENADSNNYPYNNSHLLHTNINTSGFDHWCTVVDDYTSTTSGIPIFKKAWEYMLDIPSIGIGIADVDFLEKIKVYPNPFEDKIKIEFSKYSDRNFRFDLYNNTGNLIHFEDIKNDNNKIIVLPYSLPKGIYHYKISNNTNQYQGELVK